MHPQDEHALNMAFAAARKIGENALHLTKEAASISKLFQDFLVQVTGNWPETDDSKPKWGELEDYYDGAKVFWLADNDGGVIIEFSNSGHINLYDLSEGADNWINHKSIFSLAFVNKIEQEMVAQALGHIGHVSPSLGNYIMTCCQRLATGEGEPKPIAPR